MPRSPGTKIDPGNFADLALGLKFLPEAYARMSDERSLEHHSAQATTLAYNDETFMADAIFVRATSYCTKDYMHSKGGYYALKKAKECELTKRGGVEKDFHDCCETPRRDFSDAGTRRPLLKTSDGLPPSTR